MGPPLISPSYPDWSKIKWGSPIKEDSAGIQVMHEGKWRPLRTVSPRVTKEDLMQRYLDLYGKYELPKTWVFNDFGHITCYFFKDKNNNGKLDKGLGERIHTEYFHTTPEDEAAMATGKPVTLSQSHGCIHLKPQDIDTMMTNGYFAAGNKVVVHAYNKKVPTWQHDAAASAPFELHFFPGARKVIVTGRLPSLPGR